MRFGLALVSEGLLICGSSIRQRPFPSGLIAADLVKIAQHAGMEP